RGRSRQGGRLSAGRQAVRGVLAVAAVERPSTRLARRANSKMGVGRVGALGRRPCPLDQIGRAWAGWIGVDRLHGWPLRSRRGFARLLDNRLHGAAVSEDWSAASVDGVELAYQTVGQGEPVLLIHAGVVADWFAPLLGEPVLS